MQKSMDRKTKEGKKVEESIKQQIKLMMRV